ncbi:MAG: phosphate ABC transporter ATP-binding protein PstB [Alphaproteobacteria bacterium]
MKHAGLKDLVKKKDAPVAVVTPVLRAETKDFDFWYANGVQALKNINMPVADKMITAIIGPSGCGKSTLLRSFNRMHDLYPGNRYGGKIILYPEKLDLVAKSTSPLLVRLLVGMVFQKPNPFPKSVFDNVASGLWIRGMRKPGAVKEKVEHALRQAALWEEVKDRLNVSAYSLSGGQQQRLCIARALAPDPEIILLDEPTSSLDPIGTARIEDLLRELCSSVTILIVTHNMQQASRISDYTGFMHLGELVEFGPTEHIFTNPSQKRTEDYITGRFG